jgi:hypothetical protein
MSAHALDLDVVNDNELVADRLAILERSFQVLSRVLSQPLEQFVGATLRQACRRPLEMLVLEVEAQCLDVLPLRFVPGCAVLVVSGVADLPESFGEEDAAGGRR